jgi:hypothetical protein
VSWERNRPVPVGRDKRVRAGYLLRQPGSSLADGLEHALPPPEGSLAFGCGPQGNGLRGADADGDGHSNLHEFLFGALPSQATSSLWRHEMQASGLVLTFVGRETGAAYKLMSTANLAGGAWIEEVLAIAETAAQDSVPSGHKRQQVIVPNPSGNRFFRLKAVESFP